MKCFDFPTFPRPRLPRCPVRSRPLGPGGPARADGGDGSLLLCATANHCIPRRQKRGARERHQAGPGSLYRAVSFALVLMGRCCDPPRSPDRGRGRSSTIQDALVPHWQQEDFSSPFAWREESLFSDEGGLGMVELAAGIWRIKDGRVLGQLGVYPAEIEAA